MSNENTPPEPKPESDESKPSKAVFELEPAPELDKPKSAEPESEEEAAEEIIADFDEDGPAPEIELEFEDKDTLYAAYMPYVSSGGLFVPTTQHFHLGDRVQLKLKLMEDPDIYTVPGKVIWITPKGAQGGAVAGIGIQLMGDEAETVQDKIENHLAGALDSGRPTNTM